MGIYGRTQQCSRGSLLGGKLLGGLPTTASIARQAASCLTRLADSRAARLLKHYGHAGPAPTQAPAEHWEQHAVQSPAVHVPFLGSRFEREDAILAPSPSRYMMEDTNASNGSSASSPMPSPSSSRSNFTLDLQAQVTCHGLVIAQRLFCPELLQGQISANDLLMFRATRSVMKSSVGADQARPDT